MNNFSWISSNFKEDTIAYSNSSAGTVQQNPSELVPISIWTHGMGVLGVNECHLVFQALLIIAKDIFMHSHQMSYHSYFIRVHNFKQNVFPLCQLFVLIVALCGDFAGIVLIKMML